MINPNDFRVGLDTTFELDDFGKPRLRDELELIKNIVLYILFTEPGQYPSLPHIGLGIKSLLYSHYDDIIEEDLRDQIIGQCNALGVHFENGVVVIKKIIYRDKPSLIIHIERTIDDQFIDVNNLNKYMIGISFDELDKMIYNINHERRKV